MEASGGSRESAPEHPMKSCARRSLYPAWTEKLRNLFPTKIHAEHDAFHSGSYKELLLTNRQYAFSRSGEHGTLISAVNNDEQPASISIPLPCAASDAVSLLPGEIPFSLENGRLSVTLPANGGAIFKLQEV